MSTAIPVTPAIPVATAIPATHAIPVIIDTDPGIDDAIALMLALGSPELDVLALTSVSGNVPLNYTTQNALNLLHIMGRNDIPVGRGAATPFLTPATDSAADVHGQDGMGGVVFETSPNGPDPRTAVELITDLVEQSETPITLIALGPLTNVATLITARPDIAARLGKVIIMGGGAKVLGNMTPAAEFNIWFDPEAAQKVFHSGLDLHMVGLDVTYSAVTHQEDWEPLRGRGRLGGKVLELVEFYTKFHQEQYGTSATAQHDALAVASLIKPNLIEAEKLNVNVECIGTYTRGMTVTDVKNISNAQPNVEVALGVDASGFNRFLIDRIVALDKKLG